MDIGYTVFICKELQNIPSYRDDFWVRKDIIPSTCALIHVVIRSSYLYYIYIYIKSFKYNCTVKQ